MKKSLNKQAMNRPDKSCSLIKSGCNLLVALVHETIDKNF